MSGNLMEWTESHGPCPSDICELSGGSYLSEDDIGLDCGGGSPVLGMGTTRPEGGFRCCLYI